MCGLKVARVEGRAAVLEGLHVVGRVQGCMGAAAAASGTINQARFSSIQMRFP